MTQPHDALWKLVRLVTIEAHWQKLMAGWHIVDSIYGRECFWRGLREAWRY